MIAKKLFTPGVLNVDNLRIDVDFFQNIILKTVTKTSMI